MSYGSDTLDSYRRAAPYANRILRGEKPSELPVQAPVKYELVVNLKTAKTLGLEVPALLEQRADEVIERRGARSSRCSVVRRHGRTTGHAQIWTPAEFNAALGNSHMTHPQR